MSAAIVQKNTSSSVVYFECGDFFSAASKSTDEQYLNVPTCINESKSSQEKCNLNIENPTTMSNPIDLSEKLNSNHRSENENEHYRFHSALTRTISQPQPQIHAQISALPQQQDEGVATSLVNTLIENLGNMNLHRKLERTQSEPLPQQVNTSRYKTELCRPFEEAGECKYGEKCQFAHGYHELRNLQRHPKYKTEYCRTFHSVGFCPYGPRCHFVHNADEARAQQQQQQQQQMLHVPTKLQQQQQQQQQNHSNFNTCSISASNTTYPLTTPTTTKQCAGATNTTALNHSLPLSPPLSMSTGSDRESPTGSLSLSPTSSMTSFPFGDQISPANTVFQPAFSYISTPPESPNASMSPVNTPPPTIVLGSINQKQQQQQPPAQLYIKPSLNIQGGKQVLQKSSSSPISVIRNNVSKKLTKVNSVSSLNGGDDARLPVFNRLSSAVDNFPNIAL